MEKPPAKHTKLFFVVLILSLMALPAIVTLIIWWIVEPDQKIALISGIITYAGTVILAIVTVWQNYRAQKQYDLAQKDNDRLLENNNKLISLLENSYLKEKASDIRFCEEVTFEQVKVNDYFLTECTNRESLSFYLLATENFKYNDSEITLFPRITFYFENAGYALDKVIIESLYIRSNGNYEKNFGIYNNICCRGVCFDFKRNKYKLDVILLDLDFKDDINCKFTDSFLVDIKFRAASKAKIETTFFVNLNLRNSLKTNKLLNVNYDCLDEKIIDGV